ncbi:MAG: hypothetical protein M1839_000403 [Geoglossum umbratile]|nr:MAG: hypothetical protein M1839_000403 [Geoglossum umbratile]
MAIGVAIIGSGIFVKDEHLPAVLKTPNLTLKAIYSRSEASAADAAGEIEGVDIYHDGLGDGRGYHALLLREDIQAVIIALPIPIQPSFIEKALLANKHVLSEKPIAMNLSTAAMLLNWYTAKINPKSASWCVAENFRSLDSFEYARQEILKMGRVLHFRVEVFANAKRGWKYLGGLLLDSGIHDIAGMRLLLGPENPIDRVSAFTAQIRPHLPPTDTLDAIWKTKSGVTGTFSISFGTTLAGPSSYTVGCEQGSVSVRRDAVVVRAEGAPEERTVAFPAQGWGVEREVADWARAVEAGERLPRLSPEEAYKDLVVLERMLESGERGGVPIDMQQLDMW